MMVTLQEVQSQLRRLGITNKYWGMAEVRELPHVLALGEQIQGLVNGRYEGGFATLVATDHRLLLIDKKPLYLTIEDVRYDMISEVDLNARLVDSTLCIITFSKDLRFTTIRQNRLREMMRFVQSKVLEQRQQQQHFMAQQLPESMPGSQQPVVQWLPQPANGPIAGLGGLTQFAPRRPQIRQSLTTRRNFLPKIRSSR